MSLLDAAIALACEAHAGQVDKAGQPYILHPLRLMLKFQQEEERIIRRGSGRITCETQRI